MNKKQALIKLTKSISPASEYEQKIPITTYCICGCRMRTTTAVIPGVRFTGLICVNYNCIINKPKGLNNYDSRTTNNNDRSSTKGIN